MENYPTNNDPAKNDLLQQLHTTGERFLQALQAFLPEQFNQVPYEGSWTPGMVGEHIRISVTGFADMVYGTVKDTERAPDAFVAGIRDSFLDFTIKMESPDFVVPKPGIYTQDALSVPIQQAFSRIEAAITTLDLSKTCTSFEIPVIGFMTRLEAVTFVTYHTQRHTHQLEKIRKALRN